MKDARSCPKTPCFLTRYTSGCRNESGSVLVELALVFPIFLAILSGFITFGIGVSSLGMVTRDAYVFSLLSEAADEKEFTSTTIPLHQFLVGHPSQQQQSDVLNAMRSTPSFNFGSDEHMNFFNYIAGEASRRNDAVGFTNATTYTATRVLIDSPVNANMPLEKKTVQRRIHLFGTNFTLEGAHFGLL